MTMRHDWSAEQHEALLAEIDRLIMLNPEPGSEEADRLGVLAVLVEKYEKERFPIEASTPEEAIRFRIEEQSLGSREFDL